MKAGKAGSRCVLAIGLMAVTAGVVVSAQRPPAASAQQPPLSVPAPVPALPSAPAALTVPNPFGPPPGTIDLYQRPDNFHSIAPQTSVRSTPLPYVPGYGRGLYFPGPYPTGIDAPIMVSADSAQRASVAVPAKGGLRFETQPESAQVFVDDFYVGVVADFGLRGRVLELAAGSHHVEVRAREYAPLSFNVNITANQTSRYRGDLQLMVSPPAPPVAAALAKPKTFYMIPNCYAGDKPPLGVLRPGCDLKRMRIIENQ